MNKLLSCEFLIPFSRTTYCAYLVHPIIIRYVVMKRDSPLHLTVESVVRSDSIRSFFLSSCLRHPTIHSVLELTIFSLCFAGYFVFGTNRSFVLFRIHPVDRFRSANRFVIETRVADQTEPLITLPTPTLPFFISSVSTFTSH